MTWFYVDDGLPFHHKVVAAGNPAMGLWVRAGAWSAQQLTDGHIPAHMISTLGTAAQAKRLVEVGLWITEPGGFVFHQWNGPGRQPTRSDVEKKREDARERMRTVRERSREVRANSERSSGEVTLTPTPPHPTHKEERAKSVSRLTSVGPADENDRPASKSDKITVHAHYDIDEHRIADALGSDVPWALKVATTVLGRASSIPRDPTAYVLAAIRDKPADYKPTPTAPRLADLCDHGRDARTCPFCRQELTA